MHLSWFKPFRLPYWLCVAVCLVALVPMLTALDYTMGGDVCWVCKKPFGGRLFTWKDEVTGERQRVCESCTQLPHNCYICSLPVKENYLDLKDTRFLCERDIASVVLDEGQILEICRSTQAGLDRQLSRFLSLPSAVTFRVVDRLNLTELFKIPGNDYTCPNVLGFTRSVTNDEGQAEYPISILSGMSRAATASTSAHELAHAWTMANVPAKRLRVLNRDAHEGFCELLSYICMRELGETEQMSNIQSNLYTRGQVHLFIEAEERFGLASVLDWMRQGRNDRLVASEPWRIQELAKESGSSTNTNVATEPILFIPAAPAPVSLPEKLQLKSVTLGVRSPMALINQCTLGIGEKGKVELAHTNLVIRCLAIRADSVTVELVGSGERQELRFENQKPSP